MDKRSESIGRRPAAPQFLSVLIVQDDLSVAFAIDKEIKAAGMIAETRSVSAPDDLQDALTHRWDIVVHDVDMTGVDWRTSLARARKVDPMVPFIAVSARPGEALAVEALREGCSDYVLKDGLERLGPAIEREVSAKLERIQLAKRQHQLEEERGRIRRLEVLGRWAGGLSRNLNHALGEVMTGLDVAYAGSTPSKEESALEGMLDALEVTARLARQLGSLGRGPRYRPSTTDLASLLRNLSAVVQPAWDNAAIRMDLDIAPTLPSIRADEVLLEQAMLSLLLNARDAVERSGRIRLRAYKEPGAETVLQVEDSGPGVPHELRERIFEPFFSTKGRAAGGWGLVAVLDAARAHGGRVQLETSPFGGARFALRLPSEPPDLGLVPSLEDYPDEVPEAVPNRRVLVVDDQEEARLLAAAILTRVGYGTETAVSADEAISRLKNEPRPDVVLAESLLPGGGARALLRWMEQHNDRAAPVIGVSGYEAETWPRYRLYDGFAAFLAKPFGERALAAVIAKTILARARSPR